ncbi:hypothetical protein LINPERPRIM_LOCUS23403 [Linum perenne]
MAAKYNPSSLFLALLFLPSLFSAVEGGLRKFHITDDLSDVVDDEEDEAWKEWGKKKTDDEFDPPPSDMSNMGIERAGATEVNLMGIDRGTIMFNMADGRRSLELKEFVLNQTEAYEIKIGDNLFRRKGDAPLENVIEELQRAKYQEALTEEKKEEEEEEDRKEEL